MISSVNRLYVIGNGFDLAHKLKTKYSDYKEFLKHGHSCYVKQFDEFLKDYAFVEDKSIEKWSCLEDYTVSLENYNVDELVESASDNCDFDYEDPSTYADASYSFSEETKWISCVRYSLDSWIKSIQLPNARLEGVIEDDDNTKYLTFNYTKVLEELYQVPEERILHVHGKIGDDYLVFGNNAFNKKQYLKDRGYAGSDGSLSDMYLDDAYNEVTNSIRDFNKRSLEIIKKNEEFFNEISSCEEIIFLGLSFGDQDEVYINKIISNCRSLKKVVLYVYNDKDKEVFENKFINKLGYVVEVEYKIYPR